MPFILGFLIWLIYVVLGLLPYYIAYLMIDPTSFLGVFGVFVVGSLIVPLSLAIARLLFARP